jgi:hypothetical protein
MTSSPEKMATIRAFATAVEAISDYAVKHFGVTPETTAAVGKLREALADLEHLAAKQKGDWA